jgi:hypothetical protein
VTPGRLLAVALVALAAHAACSDLPPIAAGICGNGQLDPDEDCDGAAGSGQACGAPDTSNACHYTCGAGSSAACPAGFGCGVDGRCRAPSGTFAAATTPVTFGADQLAAGAVDGDGFADLVGTSGGALIVGFGSATGLVNIDSQAIDTPSGPTTFGDLDGDGHLDAVFPTEDGVFGFLATGRSFQPLPFPFVHLDIGSGSQSVQIPPQQPTGSVRVFVASPDDGSNTAATPLIVGNAGALFFVQPHSQLVGCYDGGVVELGSGGCGSAVDFTQLLGQHVARARTGFVAQLDIAGRPLVGSDGRLEPAKALPRDLDPTDELALGVVGSGEVHLFSAAGSNASAAPLPPIVPALVTTVSLGSATLAPTGELLFGDYDEDGCLDLLIPTSAGLAIAFGTKPGGACDGELGPAEPQQPFAFGSQDLAPLAVADLDGDGHLDVVFGSHYATGGCIGNPAGGCTWQLADAATRPPRAWTDAIVSDVDRDGVPDIAGRVAGEPDVDVELGTGAFPLFDHVDLATQLPARFLDTGDYDGDGTADLVIVVGVTDATAEQDRVLVSYGDALGLPGDLVDMGAFDEVLSLTPASLIFNPLDADAITDLVVVDEASLGSAGNAVDVAALHGSSTRRLLGPLLFQRELGGGSNDEIDIPIAAVIGDYVGSDTAPDIVALTLPTSSSASTTPIVDGPDVFVAAGGFGNVYPIEKCLDLGRGSDSGDPACPGALPPATVPSFDFTRALYATARNAGAGAGGVDTLIGVDHAELAGIAGSAALFAYVPAPGDPTPPAVYPLGPLGSGADELARALAIADLDGDGVDDAIAELVSPNSDQIYIAWGPSYAPDATPDLAGCTRAVVLQADPDAPSELAALCGGSVVVFHVDGARGAWVGAPAFDAPDAVDLVAGDFDGDGVTDLAVVLADTRAVQIVKQCPAKDSSCAP